MPGGRVWTLLLAGDLMFNGIKAGSHPLHDIASLVRGSGLAFANLEVPLTKVGSPTPNKSAKELKAKSQFVLRADPRHASDIASAGFKAVGIANNHCMDYGPEGLASMQATLEGKGVSFAGAGDWESAHNVAILKSPTGQKIGLIAALAFVGDVALSKCTPVSKSNVGVRTFRYGGTLGKSQLAKLKAEIGAAKKKCDLLVVGVHWGVERQTKPTAYQVQLAHALIDCGADVVWGHHPHVLQPTEIYKGKPILYSMGNLVSALPAQTALARLRYAGNRFEGLELTPAVISNGKVKLKALASTSAPAK